MKLSTKGRYGVMAMLDLALHNSEGRISLKSIAERQDISENYLEQLFALLRKSGLVKSVRGSMGGYILAESPDKITVGAILRSLEGSLAPVDCVVEGEPASCDRSDCCVTKIVWQKIRDSINDVVDSITLHDMTEEYRKYNKKDEYMFYI